MRFKLFILKLLGISHGPWMIPVRDYWIFVDTYQRIWEIRYTGQFDIPLSVSLKER
jgi:hypothetical protein